MKRVTIGVGVVLTIVLVAYSISIATSQHWKQTQTPKSSSSAPVNSIPATTAGGTNVTPTTNPKGSASSAGLANVNFSDWQRYITSYSTSGVPWNPDGKGGSGLNAGQYNAEYFEPDHVELTGNDVTINATPGSPRAGYTWTSGAITSYNRASFDGGYLQFEAKFSDTTAGAWPAVWLVPGPTDPDRDEIDLFEGGLTSYDDANDNFTGFIHTDYHQAGTTINVHKDLTKGVQTIGISWIPGSSVTWYLNGKPVETLTSKQIRVPSLPMALTVDMQVATSQTSGWHTVASGSGPDVMKILGIQYTPNTSYTP